MARGRRGHDRPGYMERWDEWASRRDEAEEAIAPDTPRSLPGRSPTDTVPIHVLDDTPYVELHVHSNYSLLDGASRIDELLVTAREQGHRALALTDHNGMFGAMEFARAAQEHGLRPITGLEITVREDDGSRSHLTLLAETRRGYANLCRLSSIAFGLRETDPAVKEERRLDPCLPLDALAEHSEGLIALTGCREGHLSRLLDAGDLAAADAVLARLNAWFGADNLFVELQDNFVFGDRPRNRELVALATRTGIGVVGTGNVHYHERPRHRLQDVLVATRHRLSLDSSHRERRPNAEFYLRSPHEQAQRFASYHPEAALNSVRIARRCQFNITEDLGYRLPAPPVSDGLTPLQELERLCRERIGVRYRPSERVRAEERLAQELTLIERHDLAGFFLIYHEVFELAEEVAQEVRGPGQARSVTALPPGRGRGSSVSSIICYLIGLSHIDPIRNNLFVGRFLNDEMHSLPDIDLDFPRDIRARLIERVYERWGTEHAALVAIFPSYRMRSAVRDVGKALGLPAMELDRLARRAGPFERADQVADNIARTAGGQDRLHARGWKLLSELSAELSGFPRHMSQHVGGMVISSDPLIDYVPCQPAAWPNRYLCHWDKDSIDDARMVKIDFLALGMLSVVEEAVDLIASERGHVIDLSRIDFSDEAVFDDICRGDTVGVFQIESRAQIAMLPRTRPRTLEDLAIQVSIVRPGPIVGGAVNPYVRRREEQRTTPDYVPEIPHPCVREALEETLGVVIFQEQVLQVAEAMGGFTAGEADQFRRAMSRKRSLEAMEIYRERFLTGADSRGVPREVSEHIFDNLLGFAEFGFPKSHGSAFALLAYQSTWLRHYYGAEFFCALFNEQPMGFYPPHVLTNDAKRHSIDVRRPDINEGRARCSVAGPDTVRVGFGYVHEVGETGGARIEACLEDGPFQSLFDFVQRTGLERSATTNLIRVGAFDGFGLNRRELIWQLGLICNTPRVPLSRAGARGNSARQLRMEMPTEQDAVSLSDFNAYERMAADYALLSLSPDSHPMQFLRPSLGEGVLSSHHLSALGGGQDVTIAGLIVCRQRPLTARGIVFLLLEDEFGLVNVLVSRELSDTYRDLMHGAAFLKVRGTIERQRSEHPAEQRTLIATEIAEVLPDQALLMPSGKAWG